MGILIKNVKILKSGDEVPINGDIAIEGSVIKYIGTVPSDFTCDTVIDGSGFLAMPGLTNAHTHSPMTILRNYADDYAFNDWLFNKIIPAENKLSEDDVYWGALLGIAEMIKSGVTCFCDMYFYMDSVARAVSESGIRANLSFGPITSGVRGGGLTVDADKCEAYFKKWNNNGNIKTMVEIHSVYLFDKPSIMEAAQLARSLDSGIHIHLEESGTEKSTIMEKYQLSPIQAAREFGIFNVPTIAAHCVHINDSDIQILKEHNVSPVHCPSSNLKLGNGIAPVKRLLEDGLNVCLGTDGCASNNNLNMFEEAHLAALIHKGLGRDPQCMPASTVIKMMTENGAKAAGFNDTGKLEPGYKADIILVDINKPHLCPVNDLKSAVVYSVQASDVDTVIVNGEILMRNRVLVKMDEKLIMSRVREIGKKVAMSNEE